MVQRGLKIKDLRDLKDLTRYDRRQSRVRKRCAEKKRDSERHREREEEKEREAERERGWGGTSGSKRGREVKARVLVGGRGRDREKVRILSDLSVATEEACILSQETSKLDVERRCQATWKKRVQTAMVQGRST